MSNLLFNNLVTIFEGNRKENKEVLEIGARSLRLLIKDSPYHCQFFTIEDISKFFKIIENSLKEFDKFSIECFGILEQLLTFRSSEISNKILENKTIIYSLADTIKLCSTDETLLLKVSLFLHRWVYTSSNEAKEKKKKSKMKK